MSSRAAWGCASTCARRAHYNYSNSLVSVRMLFGSHWLTHRCACMHAAQIPTQDFFTHQFGLPLTMNPNLEDLSCEMIFGQAPPPIEQDEIYNAPCFAHECTLADRAPVPCPKIDTERGAKAAAARLAPQGTA